MARTTRRIAPIPRGWDARNVSDEKSDKAPHLAAYRFKPGQTGNAGGRAKGYERRIRECVESMTADDPMPDPEIGLDPATGRLRRIPAFEAICKRAVLDAIRGDKYARDFVADRLMGKPKQTVAITDADVDTDDESDLEGLTVDELRVLAKVRAAKALPPDDVH